MTAPTASFSSAHQCLQGRTLIGHSVEVAPQKEKEVIVQTPRTVVLFAPGIIKFGTHGNKYRSELDLKREFSFCLSAKTFRGPDLRRGPVLEKQRDRCKRMMSAAFSPLPKTPLIPRIATEAARGHKSVTVPLLHFFESLIVYLSVRSLTLTRTTRL